MKRLLLRSATFVKAARRLVRKRPWTAADLHATLQLFSDDAFHPLLRTHKLKGKLAGAWACSASYDLSTVGRESEAHPAFSYIAKGMSHTLSVVFGKKRCWDTPYDRGIS